VMSAYVQSTIFVLMAVAVVGGAIASVLLG
jgi:hypothetical protein